MDPQDVENAIFQGSVLGVTVDQVAGTLLDGAPVEAGVVEVGAGAQAHLVSGLGEGGTRQEGHQAAPVVGAHP